MATLPSARDLGLAPVNPSLGTVSYRGDSGMEGASSRLMVQSAGDVDKIGQFLFKAQEEQAKTDAQDGLNKYREKLNELAYSETGWTNVKGGNTNQEYFKKTQTSFDEARQAVEGSITDPLARKIFSQHAAVETIQSQSALMRHMSQQQQAYRNSTYAKTIELGMGEINNSFGNDDLFNLRIGDMARVTEDHAKANGASEEESKVAVKGIVDEAWAHRIKAALNADDVQRATELYKQARDGVIINGEAVSISTKTREAIDTMLRPAQRGNKEMVAINSTWDKLGPKSRNDPIQIEPMMDALREKYPNESASFFSNARTGLLQRAADRDTDINKADGKAYGVLQESLSSGKSISALQKMPEWAAVTPAHHAALQDKAKADAYSSILRAAAAEGRVAAREARDYARLVRQDAELTFKGYAPTYELMSNPEKLSAMSSDELTNLSLQIGQANVNRLRARQEQLKNPIRQEINQDQFNVLADEAGLQASMPTNRRQPDNNRRLVFLRDMVDSEVQKAAGKKGHPLSNEETRVVMQGILDQKVMVDEWGRDPQRSIGALLPEEVGKIYVPIEQVPAQYASDAIQYMKSVGKIPQNMSEEEAIKSYGDDIGKAYGARQIPGVKRKTIESILGK